MIEGCHRTLYYRPGRSVHDVRANVPGLGLRFTWGAGFSGVRVQGLGFHGLGFRARPGLLGLPYVIP